jgi:hypothetical protein
MLIRRGQSAVDVVNGSVLYREAAGMTNNMKRLVQGYSLADLSILLWCHASAALILSH